MGPFDRSMFEGNKYGPRGAPFDACGPRNTDVSSSITKKGNVVISSRVLFEDDLQALIYWLFSVGSFLLWNQFFHAQMLQFVFAVLKGDAQLRKSTTYFI